HDQVALRDRLAALPNPVSVLGYVEEKKDGRRRSTGKPRAYEVTHLGQSEATLTAPRPYAYLGPASYTKAIELLQRHGIALDELREDIELDVEAYRIDKVARSARPFQKHNLVTAQATPRAEGRRVPAGTILIKTKQPLGTLAAYL